MGAAGEGFSLTVAVRDIHLVPHQEKAKVRVTRGAAKVLKAGRTNNRKTTRLFKKTLMRMQSTAVRMTRKRRECVRIRLLT